MGVKSRVLQNKVNPVRLLCADQYPSFSFRYLTKNRSYNFGYFSDDRSRMLSCEGLICRMQELSTEPWVALLQKGKAVGIEMIDYSRLNFSAPEEAKLNADSKVYVIRFDTYHGAKDGRIIGFKESPCSVLNIIGFDFDFSAYDHG